MVLLAAVATTEFIDLAGGIDNFLFTRVERMALSADVNMHGIATIRRAGLEAIATATSDGHLFIFWMNLGFHVGYWLHFCRRKKSANHNANGATLASTSEFVYTLNFSSNPLNLSLSNCTV